MSERGTQQARTLGFLSLLALGINGIVGVGIFFVPSKLAIEVAGSAGIVVYLLTALGLLPVAHAFAVLGGRFEEDGGPYVWARAASGPRVAFAVGWLVYVSALFSAAAVISGLSGHLASSWGLPEPWGTKGLAAACLAVLGGVAALGLRPSAVAWNLVTVLKLIPLLLIAVLFAVAPAPAPQSAGASGLGWGSLSRGALIVVFALQGFEIVPVPAGKARHGRWAVPAATVTCLLLVAGLYAILHWACVAALPALGQSTTPLVDAARAYGGDAMAGLVSVGTGVSAVGIAFGMMAMTPRYLSVLGRREGFGTWVGVEDAKSHVPRRALAITLACVLTLVMWGKLRDLFVLSSVAVLTQYAAVVASLAVLGWRGAAGLRRRQLWSVPLALGAIAALGQAAEFHELLLTAGVTSIGLIILLARARLAR